MVNLVVMGTVGLDDIETPFGQVTATLGGSGAYASYAAAYFCSPGLISIIGRDLPAEHLAALKGRRINLDGLAQGSKTFHWSGYYEYDMNEANNRQTDLNALLEFKPLLPAGYREARYLFLACTDPVHQLNLLKQFPKRPFVLTDTREMWIKDKLQQLAAVVKKTDLLLVNDGEARLWCQTPNLIAAGKRLLAMGPQYVIIKKGEHGALMFSSSGFFSAAGYPLEALKDPTGCGDSFAGGLIGYLAKVGKTDERSIRKGIIYGSAVASFCAEGFGLEKLKDTSLKHIKERYAQFHEIRKF